MHERTAVLLVRHYKMPGCNIMLFGLSQNNAQVRQFLVPERMDWGRNASATVDEVCTAELVHLHYRAAA